MNSGESKKTDLQKDRIEIRTISPKLLWCPSTDSPSKHQFTATKVYVLVDNPQKAFAICPEHSNEISVKLVGKERSSVEDLLAQVRTRLHDQEKEQIDKGFFEKELCKKIGSILKARAYDIEFFLKYKSNWNEPPTSLPLLFKFYSNSKTSARQVSYNKDADKVPSILDSARYFKELEIPIGYSKPILIFLQKAIHKYALSKNDLNSVVIPPRSSYSLFEGEKGLSIIFKGKH